MTSAGLWGLCLGSGKAMLADVCPQWGALQQVGTGDVGRCCSTETLFGVGGGEGSPTTATLRLRVCWEGGVAVMLEDESIVCISAFLP